MSRRTLNAIVTASSLPVLLAASWLFYFAAFDGPTLCPFKLMSGVPCITCGLTRAFASLAHGEWARAMIYHPLSPIFLAYIVCWYVLEIAHLRNPEYRQPRWMSSLISVLLFGFIGMYASRLTVFFSSPEGCRSLATKNLVMRIVNRDMSNTYEPFALDTPPQGR